MRILSVFNPIVICHLWKQFLGNKVVQPIFPVLTFQRFETEDAQRSASDLAALLPF